MLVYFSLIMGKIEEASQCQDCIPKESMNKKNRKGILEIFLLIPLFIIK